MDEIQLWPRSWEELSSLRHEVFTSEPRTLLVPEFLVIRYSGNYRDGSAGRGDAKYIVATAAAARKAWYSDCTILDFRNLKYAWGDEMEWVVSISWDGVIRFHEPLAIVVGDQCQAALKTLLRDQYEQFCVDSLEDAYALCRRKVEEYEQHLETWRREN